MLLVYKPEEGLYRNIPSEGAIYKQPVAMWLTYVKMRGVVASHAPSCWLRSVQAARGRT